MDNKELAYELVKVAKLMKAENYTLSDEDRKEYDKEAAWFENELKKRDFDINERISPKYAKTIESDKGTFSINIGNIRYPDSSMITNNPWFKIGAVKVKGEGRGGVLLDKFGFKCKKVKQLHKIIVQTLEEIDKWIEKGK